MTPSVVLSRPSPCNVPHKGTLQSPSSLRPSWDAILSILREAWRAYTSAARTDLVLLIRRTVRPAGYPSGSCFACGLAGRPF
jgi:hypothetical protein